MASDRRGFTLVELLLVILILALLVQLLLPAIGAAREAARITKCKNNLRQIGIAAASHEAAKGALPGGGWNWRWIGVHGRGSGRRQPGGWVFNLLPYLDADEIHRYGANATSDEELKARTAELVTLVPHGFNCPTRRGGGPYARRWQWDEDVKSRNSDAPASYAKTDYAANGGDFYINLGQGPRTLLDFDTGRYKWPRSKSSRATGVIFVGSELPLRRIKDGLSKTYLVGEKYLDASQYLSGQDLGDDGSMYQGDDSDITRWTMPLATDVFWGIRDQDNRPSRDALYSMRAYAFGSAHATGWNVVMCDGSVHHVSYDRDAEVHRGLGNRRDGRPRR